MEKSKIAICIGDKKYQDRFVKCIMNHYANRYELHIFTDLEELSSSDERYSLMITGDYSKLSYACIRGFCDSNVAY